MPDSTPRNSTKGGICPTEILCAQHGGYFPVERQAILTHEDGSKHVYVVAECRVGGGPRHDFAEYVRRADQQGGNNA